MSFSKIKLISKRNMPCYLVFFKKCVLTKVSNVDTEYMVPSKKREVE